MNVRLDTAVYAGYKIPSMYDTMIGKLITWGNNRDEAISRMLVALDEFEIQGVENTISFQKYILNNRDFYNGKFSTAFVEKYYDDYLNKIKLAKKKKD